ncbi:hypothetical protein KEM52_000884 [Ascosphaera acerosa]|nr:hypothetical protein KEM52_000884 [Ascosphaera acerosa]
MATAFAARLTASLYGNPHSASASAQLSSSLVEDARLRVLRLVNADPAQFDVVFVANATAGIKLVAEGLRDYYDGGFAYCYLADSHTSSVGVRQMAGQGSYTFEDGRTLRLLIDEWRGGVRIPRPVLVQYPAQSNMTGQRYPQDWCRTVRDAGRACALITFTLLDAASHMATSPLDLGDPDGAPDYTVLSFYKIYGFPDLGAVIVRKSSGFVFSKRSYFGGGTVSMVTVPRPTAAMHADDHWHAQQPGIHEKLEDGTLPIHSVLALHTAMDAHERLYGSMENIASHTSQIANLLRHRIARLRHSNGLPLVTVYGSPGQAVHSKGRQTSQGPIIAFNLQARDGTWIGKSDVERTAAVRGIHLRTGTMCNPGATAHALGLSAQQMKQNYAAGQRCGDDRDVIDGVPTGAVRVSLGAMSTLQDVETFIAFLKEFYLQVGDHDARPIDAVIPSSISASHTIASTAPEPEFYVQELCVYPIKSCGAFKVPKDVRWPISAQGLDWDRTWCLVHQGTGSALTQKRYPRMALIKPEINLDAATMRIHLCNLPSNASGESCAALCPTISLHSDQVVDETQSQGASVFKVCGDAVGLLSYSDPGIALALSTFLGVPCTLARIAPQQLSVRRVQTHSLPGRVQGTRPRDELPASPARALRLSNESPLLLISQSSVDAVNRSIERGRQPSSSNTPVAPDVFRANIILAEVAAEPAQRRPFVEDAWSQVRIVPPPPNGAAQADGDRRDDGVYFDVLGSCRRCHMVCINQSTAVRSQEPYATLAKTRKIGGKILFGRHAALASQRHSSGARLDYRVAVGDRVIAW